MDKICTAILVQSHFRVFYKQENYSAAFGPEPTIQNLIPMTIGNLVISLDTQSLLRVVTQLSPDVYDFETIYPILLPKNIQFSFLIVSYIHMRNGHCGTNQLMSLVRENFWVISLRTMVNKVVCTCSTCKSYRKHLYDQAGLVKIR